MLSHEVRHSQGKLCSVIGIDVETKGVTERAEILSITNRFPGVAVRK